MKLPNVEDAYVPLAKLTDYLLSETHPIGKSKARFFRAAGFDGTHAVFLEQALLLLAQTNAVVATETSAHGTKYVIDGTIQTPRQQAITIRTVWIIDTGQIRPRFVTAYPAG